MTEVLRLCFWRSHEHTLLSLGGFEGLGFSSLDYSVLVSSVGRKVTRRWCIRRKRTMSGICSEYR